MVAEQQPCRLRAFAAAHDFDLAPEQGIVNVMHADDAAALEYYGMLDLGVAQLAVGADRRVRTDVRVDEDCPRADDRRAAHDRRLEPRARLDDDAPLDARVGVEVAV